jgi:hypothetical protein
MIINEFYSIGTHFRTHLPLDILEEDGSFYAVHRRTSDTVLCRATSSNQGSTRRNSIIKRLSSPLPLYRISPSSGARASQERHYCRSRISPIDRSFEYGVHCTTASEEVFRSGSWSSTRLRPNKLLIRRDPTAVREFRVPPCRGFNLVTGSKVIDLTNYTDRQERQSTGP